MPQAGTGAGARARLHAQAGAARRMPHHTTQVDVRAGAWRMQKPAMAARRYTGGMTHPHPRPGRTDAAVAAIRREILANIQAGEGFGGRVGWLVNEGLRQALGGAGRGWRKAAAQVANSAVAVQDCQSDAWLGRGRLSLGGYAVARRKSGATLALAAVADPDCVTGMADMAVRVGWAEGFDRLLRARPECFRRRAWRDEILGDAMAVPEIFRRLIGLTMDAGHDGWPGRFFDTPGACGRAVVDMAASGQAQGLFDLASKCAPDMVSDIRLMRGDAMAMEAFFESLNERIGAMEYAGLDFLAQEACRSPKAHWRLALALIGHGRDAGQLERLCLRQPVLAASVGGQASTREGMDLVLDAILRRREPWTGKQGNARLDMARVAGRLAGRCPRAATVGDDWLKRDLITCWEAASRSGRLEAGVVATARRRRLA